jgi:hypothetical protein
MQKNSFARSPAHGSAREYKTNMALRGVCTHAQVHAVDVVVAYLLHEERRGKMVSSSCGNC